jgi:anti-sigma28 factor (negative regulator of flagellin synthesis)
MKDSTPAEGRPPVTLKERTMQIDELKGRIQRDEYTVDPQLVAQAIVALLMRRRQSRCS